MQIYLYLFFLFLCNFFSLEGASPVTTGADRFFEEKLHTALKGKKIGLVTNHAALNKNFVSTATLFKKNQGKNYTLAAIFGPEHGYDGSGHADEKIGHATEGSIPIYSLYGENRRPKDEMLKDIELLVVDMMDVGVRTYTYVSTMCYVMEEASKRNIPVIVLDRPNPINGVTVDGPPLELSHRSFIGYLQVPYCHGMTMGELARLHNGENRIGCDLKVISMRGWKRRMTFTDTGLPWISLSPNIPEPTTPLYYPMTNLIPDLVASVNHGVGYTLPFKLVGAPWIDASLLTTHFNHHRLPGVLALPVHYRPFAGSYRSKTCHGIQLVVTNHRTYRPFQVQMMLLQSLMSLYPEECNKGLEKSQSNRTMLCKIIGNHAAIEAILDEHLTGKAAIASYSSSLTKFLALRKRYLDPQYGTS